ncbi:MAG: hypothetical protein ACP5MG_00795 [Verrucomicrobiia bacterium]|jgi:hypothetical protein
MKINEQLELPLGCDKATANELIKRATTMFDSNWWFKMMKRAVESAPEWKPPENTCEDKPARPIRHNRYRIIG